MSSTLFGCILENNVYFLIDTSRSMYDHLGFVKSQLIEVLTKQCAQRREHSKFNVIQLNQWTTRLAETLIPCNVETVKNASDWIRDLQCSSSTDIILEALLEAVDDVGVDAVYMVTAGFHNQIPSLVLEKLNCVASKVPVHSIYLKGTYADTETCEFLRDLAQLTDGSFHIILSSKYTGKVHEVIPIINTGIKRYADNYQTDALPRNRTVCSTSPTTSTSLSISGDNESLDSQILRYTDSVEKSRVLGNIAGIHFSSTPIASSIMKDIRVLARIDRDGLFYLGVIKNQGPNNSFFVKFESCPTLRKSDVQEILVENIISYNDAHRHNISLGDKVLAPWQNDERYGPGTVLDGYETRSNPSGDKEDHFLLVTFFNGQTVYVKHGVALWIPDRKFERISLDVQLPESQRKKQRVLRNQERSISREETQYLLWENEKLKREINEQIEENSNLIRALDLNVTRQSNQRYTTVIGRASSRDLRSSPILGAATSYDLTPSPVIGRATSRDLRGDYDSGVFSDEENEESSDMYTKRTDSYEDVITTRNNKQYNVNVTPRFSTTRENKTWAKCDKQEKFKQPWRYTAPCSSSYFRKTSLEKPRDPGERLQIRPKHVEYQTIHGCSFPPGTDRKFEKTPDKGYQHSNHGVWKKRHLQHSEYQDVAGIKFPSAADRKFKRSINVNWSPDTALCNAERSSNCDKGLEQTDGKTNAPYANMLEQINSNKGRYLKTIEDNVAVVEARKTKGIEFQRNKETKRVEEMEERKAEQERIKTSRMEHRRGKHEEILKEEQLRTEKVEKWKHDRIKSIKERQMKFNEIENSRELKNDAREARRLVRRRMKEQERREEFHEKLREEWRAEDERAEQNRRRYEDIREKITC